MVPKDAANIPLSLVNDYGKKYPGIWEDCARMHDTPETPDFSWDKSICYLPIGGAVAIQYVREMPGDTAYILPALASWRRAKEVYTFDPDMAEALYQQASDTTLPCEIIMHLPFPCVYIDSGKYRFFAYLENDPKDGRWELRFSRILDNGSTAAYFLHLGDFTLSESLAAGMDEGQRQLQRLASDGEFADIVGQADASGYQDWLNTTAISEMLQLVLYICAENADLEQNRENKQTYRKPHSSSPKDKFREVRQWDTGVYIGSNLRRAAGESSGAGGSAGAGTGSSKRTHIRRGHWHHFWRGTGKDKNLILRWVLPVIVNGSEDDEPPARVTQAK